MEVAAPKKRTSKKMAWETHKRRRGDGCPSFNKVHDRWQGKVKGRDFYASTKGTTEKAFWEVWEKMDQFLSLIRAGEDVPKRGTYTQLSVVEYMREC